jgi:hypothetical protein
VGLGLPQSPLLQLLPQPELLLLRWQRQRIRRKRKLQERSGNCNPGRSCCPWRRIHRSQPCQGLKILNLFTFCAARFCRMLIKIDWDFFTFCKRLMCFFLLVSLRLFSAIYGLLTVVVLCARNSSLLYHLQCCI